MEIFVDFGLFELLIGIGLAAVARFAYTRKVLGIVLLAVSILAPILLLLLVDGEGPRWLAAICVATSLVNAALIASIMRRHDLHRLLARGFRSGEMGGRRPEAEIEGPPVAAGEVSGPAPVQNLGAPVAQRPPALQVACAAGATVKSAIEKA